MIDVTKPLETSDGVAIDAVHNSIYHEIGDYYVMPRRTDSFWFNSKTGVARKSGKGDAFIIMPFTVRNVNLLNVGDLVAKRSDPTVLFGTIIATTASGDFPVVVETVAGQLFRRRLGGQCNLVPGNQDLVPLKSVVVRHEYHRLFASGNVGECRDEQTSTFDTVCWLKTTYTNDVATFSVEGL